MQTQIFLPFVGQKKKKKKNCQKLDVFLSYHITKYLQKTRINWNDFTGQNMAHEKNHKGNRRKY